MSQTLDAVLERQRMPDKHRFPAVLQPIGLDEEQNASIDLFGTLKARTEGGGFEGTVLQPSLYESHPNDSRVTGPVEQCPTVSARWGTGGNNTPLVTDGSIGFAENFNAIELTQTAPAMTTSGYSPTQNAGGLGALQCNAEQSAKAYSIAPGRQGTPEKVDDIHVTEQDTSRTLDGTCADPERRQGGTLIVQPSFAYDDRNQAVSTDTHHTLRGEAAGSRVSDAVVQSGEASAFSWQCRGDMRGMVPRPTAQLQRCQIEAVMVPEQSGYETVPALTASGRGVERPGESRGQDPVVAVNRDAVQTMHVRRLTPVECERLQGFPDGWTDIRPNGKETPDSPRYKALGNSMAVPVMRWIGMRIAEHTSADANHFVDSNKLVVVTQKESERG